MNGAIAVFVKTPGQSPVKTRLAASLGRENAELFHLTAARSVVSVTQQMKAKTDIKNYYAVAEQSALEHHYWQDLPCLWQGEGGLGERMAHIYQTLLKKHDYVILVGADIPQMTAKELLKAVDWLIHREQARLTFAPSVDGGFWMLGGNCNIPHNIWTEVVYSRSDTGIQFFNKIDRLGDIKMMSCLRDVDEVHDLIPLRENLTELSEPSPEQRELLKFLDNLPEYQYA